MNSKRPDSLQLICSALLLLVVAAGCGGGDGETFPRAAVRGTVTLDGSPLPEGIIRFVPQGETEGPKSSISITDGAFEADEEHGPVPGSHRVEIESTDDGGYAMDDEEALEKLKAAKTKRIRVLSVPAIYNDKSQLTAEISLEEPNELKFELSTRPSRNSPLKNY